jgi:demethylmenaquinone methyltransferase/2-methoxy-6-polyprenyl-1,4-benzoquinol methylase
VTSRSSGAGRSVEAYDRLAPRFDRRLRLLAPVQERIRHRAITLLGLRPGQVVLDVGCGTGASFPLLEEALGREGAIVGCDQSAGMLTRARARIAEHGWDNVTVIETPAEHAVLPLADAALFFFTHDILRNQPALRNVLAHVKPGGRVVAAGGKRVAWWNPANVVAWLIARAYVSTLEGAARPWDRLADELEGVELDIATGGFVYIMSGQTPEP